MLSVWTPALYHPTEEEVLSGYVTGLLDGRDLVAEQAAALPKGSTARSVLHDLVVAGLSRPPCVISFSGGRDSSALLAVTADAARKEGLPLPVAATFRYEGEPETEETEWQELVVRHVGVGDWEKLDIGNAHDVLSPAARELLLDEGLCFPASLSAKTVINTRAAGGTVMSGEGGDEIFGRRRSTVFKKVVKDPAMLRKRRGLREAALYLGPQASRSYTWRRALGNGLSSPLSYLKKDVFEGLIARLAAHQTSEPFDNSKSLAWHLRRKLIVRHQESLTALALRDNARHFDPFLDPRFVAAYARQVRPFGLLSRTHAMRFLFADMLPDSVLTRESKAVFNRAMLTDVARDFALNWKGGGINTDYVDVDALRAAWLSDWPPVQSFCLMQQAWLSENQGSAPDSPQGLGAVAPQSG